MDTTAAVKLLGGLGLFLLGIHHLTEGLKGFSGDSLRRALQRLVAGRFSAVISGALFTAVIQSSSAATDHGVTHCVHDQGTSVPCLI